MNAYEMTRKQLESLPHREWNEEIECRGIIIIPAKINFIDVMFYKIRLYLSEHIKYIKKPEIYEISGMHDSGFICMDFVAVDDNADAICLLSGCSDVIHFDGIGGFGYDWLTAYGSVPFSIPPSGWNMDCLPKSGLLHIWCSKGKIRCGSALSSFEIYAMNRKKELEIQDEQQF